MKPEFSYHSNSYSLFPQPISVHVLFSDFQLNTESSEMEPDMKRVALSCSSCEMPVSNPIFECTCRKALCASCVKQHDDIEIAKRVDLPYSQIESLPLEVLERVFYHLDFGSIIAVNHVSSRFREVAASVFPVIDSVILTEEDEKIKLMNFLRNKHAFKLLFRASRDGDSCQKFHELCDNQGEWLLTINTFLYHAIQESQ